MKTTHRSPSGWFAVLIVGLFFFTACEARPEAEHATADADTPTAQAPAEPPDATNVEAPRGKITSFAADQVYMNAAGEVESLYDGRSGTD